MPLQNRVDPLGELHVASARGGCMGNRGGRLHRDDRTLGPRRWRSKAWIYCRTQFKARRRAVMGQGYTELFFLDEATALAAGHRPCFECSRQSAIRFALAWAQGQALDAAPRAPEMDAALHAERLEAAAAPGRPRSKVKRLEPARLGDLPPGAMVQLWGESWLLTERWLLRWTFNGYDTPVERDAALDGETVLTLTPPSILAALRGGYRPEAATGLL